MDNQFVYLTFDDGPDEGTQDILDVLKEAEIKATFFVNGVKWNSTNNNIYIVERIYKEEHSIGNHCFAHFPETISEYLSIYGDLSNVYQKSAFRNNYDKNTQLYRKILEESNFTFPFARLPGDGRMFPKLVSETELLGMRHITWHFEFAPNNVCEWVKFNNWQGICGVASSHPNHLIPCKGQIILLHDRHWKGTNIILLQEIIRKFQAQSIQIKLLIEDKYI